VRSSPLSAPNIARPNSLLCAAGLIEIPVIIEAPERTKLSDALERYTDYIQYHRSLRTFRTYRPILKSFDEFCTHTYVDEIDRATIMEFATHCLKLGQNGKTIYNKLVVICQLLKQYGRTKILNANDVHRDTIMRLGVKVGQGCTALMDETRRDLRCTRLELDEIWGFVGKNDRNVRLDESAPVGSVWTFCAIDADTKLVPAFKVGERDNATATAFMHDVASRMRNRVQISTDGLRAYVDAVEKAFGSEVDYAQIVRCMGKKKSVITAATAHPRLSLRRRRSLTEILICVLSRLAMLSG
jgi:IS1 family transposase